MILVPTHACIPDAPGAEPSIAYGDLDASNVATCAVRVRWGLQRGQDERLPGCGTRLALCHGCGLRTRVLLPGELEAAPCEACGGTERPIQDHVLTQDPPRASSAGVDPTRSIVEPETKRDDARPDPVTREQRPARRAPARRVKKGAADQGDDLALFK